MHKVLLLCDQVWSESALLHLLCFSKLNLCLAMLLLSFPSRHCRLIEMAGDRRGRRLDSVTLLIFATFVLLYLLPRSYLLIQVLRLLAAVSLGLEAGFVLLI